MYYNNNYYFADTTIENDSKRNEVGDNLNIGNCNNSSNNVSWVSSSKINDDDDNDDEKSIKIIKNES